MQPSDPVPAVDALQKVSADFRVFCMYFCLFCILNFTKHQSIYHPLNTRNVTLERLRRCEDYLGGMIGPPKLIADRLPHLSLIRLISFFQ